MQVLGSQIVQNILKQLKGAQIEQRPHGAEPLFCFHVGPVPTTLAQHENNSGSTCCASDTMQRQVQCHLFN